MKYIEKKDDEPKAFSDWKEQEKEKLENCFNRGTKSAECAWDHLPSNLPLEPEDGIHYYSKYQLKASLLDEQGFICAFCTDLQQNNHKSTIDHLTPKSSNPREYTYNYFNLLAVCGGENAPSKPKKEKFSHCNNKKGESPIMVSPLDHACEDTFIFSIDGNIYPKFENEANAIETISTLGLDSPILIDKRKSAIEKEIFPRLPFIEGNGNLIENNEPITKVEAVELLASIDQKKNDKYIPFCIAIKCVLKDHFIK